MTTPTTPPVAQATPVVSTEAVETTAKNTPKVETKPTSNWPWVSAVWLKEGDNLLAKICKIAICWISVPLAGIRDILAKCYTWATTKPEEDTSTEDDVSNSEATDSTGAPAESTEDPAVTPGIFSRTGSLIKDPRVSASLGFATPFAYTYVARPLMCAIPIIGRACL